MTKFQGSKTVPIASAFQPLVLNLVYSDFGFVFICFGFRPARRCRWNIDSSIYALAYDGSCSS
ncbi:MAG: hypothetical protein C4530_03760 [Desulfobacteraceae bacterium]|nr:MAG: hypothetical protein C4530_03760 [Desulfobacteraceae bacterium]